MKRQYIKPASKFVRIRLYGSILEEVGVKPASNTSDTFGAREQQPNRFDWDDENEE